MRTAIPVDVGVLRDEITKTYTDVSMSPAQDFAFPPGRSHWPMRRSTSSSRTA